MKTWLMSMTLCGILFTTDVTSDDDSYTIYTEELPPISYKSGDQVSGIATDIVKEIFKRADIKSVITLQPWKRAFFHVQDNPSGFLYAMSRTEQREKRFQWIGPFMFRETGLWSLKERTEISPVSTLEDLKKYTIGVTRGEAYHQLLLSNGFKDGIHIQPVNQSTQNAQKLLLNRIDMMVGSNYSINMKFSNTDNPDIHLEKIYVFATAGYYIGANLNVSQTVIKKLNDSLSEIKASSFIKELHAKYNLTYNEKLYKENGFGEPKH